MKNVETVTSHDETTKVVVTRCIFRARNVPKCACRRGSVPDPTAEACILLSCVVPAWSLKYCSALQSAGALDLCLANFSCKQKDHSLFLPRCMDDHRTLPLSPPKGGGSKKQNGHFPSIIELRLKKVCYKVSLCENCQRQSCRAFIGLTIHAKIIGGGRRLLPEILG